MFVIRIFILLLTRCSVQGQVTRNLYPYGSGTSDNILTNGNDISAGITLSTRINFYGDSYITLYVSTNGVLSLGSPTTEPQTNDFFNSFPLYPGWKENGGSVRNALVAPFWADVDTSNNRGNIYYRQSTDTSLLNIVTGDVRDLFILYSDFTATWAFIATWNQVSFYNHQVSNPIDPRNTFQVVLTTDGVNTFAFFRYETVEWSAGTSLNGNPVTGIPERQYFQAVVGFNKGDGLNGYENGFPGDVLNLDDKSRVDVAGVYAFKIDSEDIISAGCEESATTLYTYPVFGNMFGGERVYVIGPCWNSSVGDHLKCRFSSSEGVELHISSGTVEDRQSAYCVPEPFFLVGEVTLEVSTNGGNTWNYRGVYKIVYPGRVTNIGRVTRVSSSSSDWETAGNPLTVTWDTVQFETDDRLDAHVLAYREDGSGPRWEEVYTIATDVENTGSITFTPIATEMVTAENAFGLIRVEPTNGGIGRKLYTTEHALGYVLEQGYQENPIDWSNVKCLEWADADDALPPYTDSLLHCPCTLDQALTDSGRFQPDTGCSMFAGSVCTYHMGAKHCVRSVFASSKHAGTQCCYDGNGYLMYAGDTDQGSTNDRSHVWGSEPYLQADMVPSLSHWKHDVISFYYCCLWGTNCRSYMTRRITVDCANYETAEHAAAFGDPHIITFDNANYTFNGKGEFTLTEITRRTRFRLDGRFEVIPAYSTSTAKQDGATGLTALVMFEYLSDVIQVEKDHKKGLVLYRSTYSFTTGIVEVGNWIRISFRDQTWLDLKGMSITINNQMNQNVVTSLTVMFRSSSIGVNVTCLQDNEVLSVFVILPPQLQGTSYISGMFGNFNGDASDDLQTRYGRIIDPLLASDEEIYQTGLTWRTSESTLFRYGDKTFDDLRNDTNYNPLLTSPDETSLTLSQLEFMGNTCGDVKQCRFDFLVTRDESIATATSLAVENYQWAEEKMIKLTSCTFIPTPRDGTKIYSQMENGEGVSSYSNNFVGTVIEFKCDENYVLEGSPRRTCQDYGTYSGSEVNNDCIYSPCGSLPVVENGYMVVTELDGYQVVTTTCDQGYLLDGSSDRRCNGKDWSGTESRCLDRSKCLSPGLIVICCVEGVVIIAMIFVVGFLYSIKKGWRKGRAPNLAIQLQDTTHNANSGYMDLQHTNTSSPNNANADVPYENLKLREPLPGKGLVIYQRAQMITTSKREEIVLKTVSDDSPVRLEKLQVNEVRMLSTLPSNENVVQFFGCCHRVPTLLCFEFVSGNNLLKYLEENFQRSKIHQCNNTKQKRFHVAEKGSVESFPKFALQIARGMKYLTAQKFLHPGLRSEKVIINVSGQCKLYDFVSKDNAKEILAILWDKSVPYQWMPPEYLFLEKLDPTVDVWSFGVVLWEIFSYGAKPFEGKGRSDVEKRLREKKYLEMPNYCPGAIWQIVLNCWEQSPEKRPSFDHLYLQLSHMCNDNKKYYEIHST